MANTKAWIEAFRLRTLPLALSCVGLGSFLAAEDGRFRGDVFAATALTITLLQILSNLANDYGDSIHGADSVDRSGPQRAVQSGAITSQAMKKAMIGFGIASFISGCALLWLAFGFEQLPTLLLFLGLGIASIWAAVAYTATSNPYGYAGLGDTSVLMFFGFVGVFGTYYLYTTSLDWGNLLPSLSCGLFSVAVLNINNIRDIESDQKAGKYSIPVRLGREKAVVYHWLLLGFGLGSAVLFTVIEYTGAINWLFLLVAPLFLKNGLSVSKNTVSNQLDPYLKQMAISTLLFVLTFGMGRLLAGEF